jgi:hypothetical protein
LVEELQFSPDDVSQAPNAASDTYWICNDNYLAGIDLTERYGVPPCPLRWSVLFGKTAPEDAFQWQAKVIDLGGGVKSETDDFSGVQPDWKDYADRLLLAAINARRLEDEMLASALTLRARYMWDGRTSGQRYGSMTKCRDVQDRPLLLSDR